MVLEVVVLDGIQEVGDRKWELDETLQLHDLAPEEVERVGAVLPRMHRARLSWLRTDCSTCERGSARDVIRPHNGLYGTGDTDTDSTDTADPPHPENRHRHRDRAACWE
ncbi:unnamed protein product [Merluccius merluccius]